MKFIELTFFNSGDKMLINIDSITFMEADSDRGTYVNLGYQQYVNVKEKLSDIKALIEQEEKRV